jgi:hypothetical protein
MAKPKAWVPTAAEQSLFGTGAARVESPKRGGMLRLFAVLNLRDLGQKIRRELAAAASYLTTATRARVR